MRIRELTPLELDRLKGEIVQEEHFLYSSYLSARRARAVHYGQFADSGELLGVLAYLRGMPFHAFAVYPLSPSFCLRSAGIAMRDNGVVADLAACNTIVNGTVFSRLASQIELVQSNELLLMTHRHEQQLPPSDPHVLRLTATDEERVAAMMAGLQTMAFTKEELAYPFLGIVKEGQLVAAGGYHLFSAECVEIGNIGTVPAWRRRGCARKICAELTRLGKREAQNGAVYLNVLAGNESAVQLYRSLGYKVVCRQWMIEFRLG